MDYISISALGTLPCVTFVNTGLGNKRSTWVCRSASDARAKAGELEELAHITDVEVMDAIVKDESDDDIRNPASDCHADPF
jgi:hypothetical protein